MVINDKEKQEIISFKTLEPANVLKMEWTLKMTEIIIWYQS